MAWHPLPEPLMQMVFAYANVDQNAVREEARWRFQHDVGRVLGLVGLVGLLASVVVGGPVVLTCAMLGAAFVGCMLTEEARADLARRQVHARRTRPRRARERRP
jgi:hypothetical protein